MFFPLRFSFALPAFAAASCLGAPVDAASHLLFSAEPLQLERLDVTATRGPSLTVTSLDAAIAELGITPGGFEVIDASRFRRGRASTVEDVFALSPGVFAQARFGSDEARISIRGSGIQRTFHGRGLRVSQDGVPVNLADGSFDMQAFEPLAAAHVDVLRGGNALTQGASTLGGAIDFVSFTGRGVPPPVARVEAGSFGYVRAAAATSGRTETWDGLLVASATRLDGFRDHAEQENQRLFANAGWRIEEHAESRWFVTWVNTRSDLPGNLTKAELLRQPRASDPASATQDRERNFRLARVANKTAVAVGDTLWEAIAAWTYKDLDHPISPVVDQVTNDALLGVNATHRAGDWLWRGGVRWQRGEIRAANYVNVLGTRGALTARADQVAENVEGFLEAQRRFGTDWTAIAGFSAAENRRRNDQFIGPTPDYSVRYRRVSPRIGVRGETPLGQLFANVSGSYEPPSFSEALTLNTARRAQTAATAEIGIRGTRGAWRWDAAVYHARIRGEFLSLVDPVTLQTSTVNADRTLHDGVEFGGECDLWRLEPQAASASASGDRLVLRGSWTYGRFRFDDDARYGRNALAGLPPHLVRGELTWEASRGWYAGPTWEWVPRGAYIDHRNTFSSDAYALVGFRVGRRQASGLTWFLDARNLFDRRYAATTGVIENAGGADQRQFLPGDGRSIYAGVEFRR